VRRWFKREALILWFGSSVCSFPVAGFLAFVLMLIVNPSSRSFLNNVPSPLEPILWLTGCFYGFFTGLALAIGAPALYQSWRKRDGVAVATLALAVAGFTVIRLRDGLNAIGGYDLIHGSAVPAFTLLRVVVYVAFGFSLARFFGVRIALATSFVIATFDVLLEVAAMVGMSHFGGFVNIWQRPEPDFVRDISIPIFMWTVVALFGIALSRTRLGRAGAQGHVYKVKLR
jgi:hypothetical protein